MTQYSLQAEEKRRRQRKRKKRSPGRRKTCLKFADAEQGQDVYPEEGRRAECVLVREHAVWRLEKGRAVLVGYRVFRAPGGENPSLDGGRNQPVPKAMASNDRSNLADPRTGYRIAAYA